ncbi:HNH endonuclease [Acinetobacter guillouiae]|uniref:HNH endonuclease n=1 Tax=Acinetobacter guillouiae TaxID=106649 RepID=UPI0028D162CE|nr:HNH endonuclease [Acinetobacter guillouiae]
MKLNLNKILSIFKLNKNNSFISKFDKSYEIIFSYSEFMHLKNKTFLYDISEEKKYCIFCLRKRPLATFEDNSHVIPYSLGNEFLFHKQECIDCNKIFGDTIESELASFITKYRIINGAKNRNKKNPGFLKYQNKNQNAFLKMNQENNRYNLEVSGKNTTDVFQEIENDKISLIFETKYRDSDVYKALMKSIYGVIPAENRKDFTLLRKWINTEDHNVKLISKLIMYQTILPTIHPNNLVFNVFKRKNSLKNNLFKRNYFKYFALIGYGNMFLDIPLISDDVIGKTNLKLTLLSSITISNKGAIQTMLDMSNTVKRDEKTNLSFTFEEKIPRS